MTTPTTPPRHRKSATPPSRRWSRHVTETSDALDLPQDVFKSTDPKRIARALKASAEHGDRRRSDPFRSAMSMITFYVNRAGANLAATQRHRLERAKDELRVLFGRSRRGGATKTAHPARAGSSPSSKASPAARRSPRHAAA